MAFQLSPGVNVSEIDLTTVVPAVATSDGAFAGVFRWGPIGQRVLLDTENQLKNRFGDPTNHNAETWFTAANFLAYSNRLWVSRAANTSGSTPWVSSAVLTTNASITVATIANTSGLEVGMYVTQANNAAVTTGESTYITSVNSSAVVLSGGISTNATSALYFGRPQTTYSAVAFDSANASAKAANLVHQIVKNDEHYTSVDGTFDSDVIYVARFPGKMGNSLRIGVCDNAASFQSNVALVGNTVTLNSTSVDTRVQFQVGSDTAVVKFRGSANTASATYAATIAVGDQILAGNSSIGQQYMQVRSISTAGDNTSNVVFNGNTDINANLNFITVASNPFSNGDAVVYANVTGSVTGLSNSTYYVVEANSSGIKLSTTPWGAAVSIAPNGTSSIGLTSNTNTLSVTLEDPYRLREYFVSNTVARYWEFFNVVETAPGQSTWQLENGNTSANDEMHIVVVDDGGLFTGTPGQVLEVYKGVSRATDSKNLDGSANYYKDVINQGSQYIWWASDRTGAASSTGLNLVSSTASAPLNVTLALGADGFSESTATLGVLGAAYDLFQSVEDIDISLVLQGKPMGGTTVVNGQTVSDYQLANYIIDNIVETRKDCIVLVSPPKSLCLNNVGDEAVSLKNWRGALHSSSYAVMDSGYKYQYDKYNDLYRWVPLNGDIAGTCVRTDNTNDAWWSPAGYNRGQIKNVVKLAWNPRKSERDVLYSNGINPVITSPGQGTILFGDKTLQAKPSAFDRINVRRLFIVLEKAISTAAKYQLFEFNDAFTRAQFKNLVVPYLRTVKGRRGITDFQVICDDTNNTPAIIDSNQFVGDIYIKPARSINFIQLNFVAVPSGVQFSEIVGKF